MVQPNFYILQFIVVVMLYSVVVLLFFSPTLYVGEYGDSLFYALPALVDSKTVTIAVSTSHVILYITIMIKQTTWSALLATSPNMNFI